MSNLLNVKESNDKVIDHYAIVINFSEFEEDNFDIENVLSQYDCVVINTLHQVNLNTGEKIKCDFHLVLGNNLTVEDFKGVIESVTEEKSKLAVDCEEIDDEMKTWFCGANRTGGYVASSAELKSENESFVEMSHIRYAVGYIFDDYREKLGCFANICDFYDQASTAIYDDVAAANDNKLDEGTFLKNFISEQMASMQLFSENVFVVDRFNAFPEYVEAFGKFVLTKAVHTKLEHGQNEGFEDFVSRPAPELESVNRILIKKGPVRVKGDKCEGTINCIVSDTEFADTVLALTEPLLSGETFSFITEGIGANQKVSGFGYGVLRDCED